MRCMCSMRSPPLTYSITKYTRVSVWKHECSPSKNGCRSLAAAKNTRFSERVLVLMQRQKGRMQARLCSPLNFVVVNDKLLLQNLDGIKVVGLLLLSQHNFSEIALTQDSQEVEVL